MPFLRDAGNTTRIRTPWLYFSYLFKFREETTSTSRIPASLSVPLDCRQAQVAAC
jgi:hypothetical protein